MAIRVRSKRPAGNTSRGALAGVGLIGLYQRASELYVPTDREARAIDAWAIRYDMAEGWHGAAQSGATKGLAINARGKRSYGTVVAGERTLARSVAIASGRTREAEERDW